jgi:hypothetical protein
MLLNRPPLIHHQTLTVRHSQPQQRRLRLDGWLLPLLLVLLRHLLVVWLLNILQKGGTQRHSPAHAKLLLLGKLALPGKEGGLLGVRRCALVLRHASDSGCHSSKCMLA